MAEDQHPRGANEPEKGANRRSHIQQRQADNEERRIEMFLGDSVVPELGGLGCIFIDGGEPKYEEGNGDYEEVVGKESINGQSSDD